MPYENYEVELIYVVAEIEGYSLSVTPSVTTPNKREYNEFKR